MTLPAPANEFTFEEIAAMLARPRPIPSPKPRSTQSRKPKRHRQCPGCFSVFPDQGFSPHHGDKFSPDRGYFARGGNTPRTCPACHQVALSSEFPWTHGRRKVLAA